MKTRVYFIALMVATLLGCQSTSGSSNADSDSGYGALAGTALTTAMQAWGAQGASNPLADTIQQATNVSNEQAVGGLGSLLALAQNSLGSEQNSELSSLIPGYGALESTGLTSLVTNNSSLNSAFSALGLDPSMVSTFAPLIINGLKAQGASSSLLSSLTSLWQ
ncbi:hypothetical protein VST7929_01001 [Vibrio stylophorae]|uniref:DUF2780 domain-containing protein n=1 Tax=Vibrio stylophorae TaxID=659351 RepID=A0ABN8DTL9_9VIBR|nr:DUF2780 domain-containing protein [Vibrio stylophorae]CAH0533140.1 hypothetical protein VST7929_01001 [Vibrio stylophorae]